MKKFTLFFLGIFLINLSFVNASLTNVYFNGTWENGTTLYSDWYHLENQEFYGKDVYPIKESTMNQKQKICITEYREKRKRVCHYEIIGGRKKRICEIEVTLIPYERCKYKIINPVKIGCLNPDGVYTNQLNLINFEYSFDGVNWNSIPYPRNEIYINDSDVLFRLVIPSECSPVYNYNKAIFI